MDETKTRPGFPGDRAQIAAEKLRALRERANHALDEHRQRLAQIESELNLRVRQLAEEFETAATTRKPSEGHDQEVAALREQLESDRAKHDKFVEQLALARRQLDAIQAQPCAACQDAAHQLADAHGEITRLGSELQSAQRERDEQRGRHDKISEQVAAARQAISDLQAKSLEQTAGLQSEVDEARSALAAAEKESAAAKRDLELLTAEYDALQARKNELEREHASSLEQLRQSADQEAEALREQIAASRAELDAASAALTGAQQSGEKLDIELSAALNERDALSRHLDQAREQQAALETKVASLEESLAGDLQHTAEQLTAATRLHEELQGKFTAAESETARLAASLAEAAAETGRLEHSLNAARREIESLQQEAGGLASLKTQLGQAHAEAARQQTIHEELKSLLEQAQNDLGQLRDASCPRGELADLQQKCDLALGDVQKLKRENSSLREELASRPEATDEQSPELVALRAECETLSQRVKELERAAAANASSASNSSSDMEDLQRRFEMAVDDVRELKQENARLREQAAKVASTAGAAPALTGGNDWAAQRARLVAMLESEEGEGPIDAERRKERAKIEDAIERTDRLLAEKDRELAEMRATQEAYTTGASCTVDIQREEVLSADEVVAAERKRLADLQTEWEDKLRKAELEFSVERAKLAREQAAVKERLFELQKLEAQGAGLAAESGDNKPRRRWLSALGLHDDEETKPK